MFDYSLIWGMLTQKEQMEYANFNNCSLMDAQHIWWYEHNKYVKEERERFIG